jgi:hypothetical protein
MMQEKKLKCNGAISRASKHTKQKLIEVKGKTDKFTIAAGDFNTLFSELLK